MQTSVYYTTQKTLNNLQTHTMTLPKVVLLPLHHFNCRDNTEKQNAILIKLLHTFCCRLHAFFTKCYN